MRRTHREQGNSASGCEVAILRSPSVAGHEQQRPSVLGENQKPKKQSNHSETLLRNLRGLQSGVRSQESDLVVVGCSFGGECEVSWRRGWPLLVAGRPSH